MFLSNKISNANCVSNVCTQAFFLLSVDPDKVSAFGYRKKKSVETRTKRKKILVDKLMEGVKLHRCLKKYLESDGKEVEVDPVIIGCWGSLEKLLPNISNIKMVEESIQHPVLMYKGVLDCVATYE